ncbi:MAG TPA: hypothetical protein VF702_09190 [Allosphingosinicella sp.]|jgi:hypothetical protein
MFNFDIRQVAAAAIGALLLSTACVGAAVGPIHAATPAASQAAA